MSLNIVKMYASEKKEVNVIITIIIIIIEYTGICLNKQSFEYARVFNMLDIKHSLRSLILMSQGT